ncbi:MAG: histidinol-phosphatase HisJ family protein [Bacilli bacterium]|nr:histidinol-phosphatase HisJ family protein [Bacilli bacterium]
MNKYKDSHVHTNISHDGISTIDEYLQAASKRNVDEITFTEHYDDYTGLQTNLKTLDVKKYMEEYLKHKNDKVLKTNFGLEIGLQPDIKKQVSGIVKSYPLDFVIGSSHITCKKDMATDKSFFEGLTRKEAYLRYFREVLENVKIYKEEFDVYGHLDYVVRYGGYDSKKIEYNEFKEILDSILSELIKKDKGIEINTSGFRYGLSSAHPNIDIIKRYIELGGKIITIGSDAHKVEHLAENFDKVYEFLEYLNVHEIAVFHNRKPEFIKILK